MSNTHELDDIYGVDFHFASEEQRNRFNSLSDMDFLLPNSPNIPNICNMRVYIPPRTDLHTGIPRYSESTGEQKTMEDYGLFPVFPLAAHPLRLPWMRYVIARTWRRSPLLLQRNIQQATEQAAKMAGIPGYLNTIAKAAGLKLKGEEALGEVLGGTAAPKKHIAEEAVDAIKALDDPYKKLAALGGNTKSLQVEALKYWVYANLLFHPGTYTYVCAERFCLYQKDILVRGVFQYDIKVQQFELTMQRLLNEISHNTEDELKDRADALSKLRPKEYVDMLKANIKGQQEARTLRDELAAKHIMLDQNFNVITPNSKNWEKEIGF